MERDSLLTVVLASPNRLTPDLDGTKQETLRQQAIGKYHGLNNLLELVKTRKVELIETVKRLDEINQ